MLIIVVYALIIYQRQQEGRFDLTVDFSKWGIVFLVFVGVSIVARIIIYIIFHIINAIVTREEEIPVTDERDKFIELKATRNAYRAFSVGFVLSVISLSIGMPVYGIIIAFFVCCFLAEIVENGSQIYYYRKGIQ